MSLGQLMQVAAWGLGLGTLFFAFFGQARPRDFFLAIGLVACIFGDLAFVAFLSENDGGIGAPRADGKRGNDTMVTLFVGLALFALYGLGSQLWKYKEQGFLDEEDDEEDAQDVEERRAAAAAAAVAAGNAARPGVAPPEEAAAPEARRGKAAKRIRDADAAAKPQGAS